MVARDCFVRVTINRVHPRPFLPHCSRDLVPVVVLFFFIFFYFFFFFFFFFFPLFLDIHTPLFWYSFPFRAYSFLWPFFSICPLGVPTARPLWLLSRPNGDSRPHPAENSIRTENPELQVLSSAVKGPLSNVRTHECFDRKSAPVCAL